MCKVNEQFHLEEYKSLRSEVLETVKEIPSVERLSLLMYGAIWTWYFTKAPNIDPTVSRYFIFLPLVISALFFLRINALKAKLKVLGAYLKDIETELGSDNLGWEAHLDARGNNIFSRFGAIFWGLQITGNLCLALVINSNM